MITESPKNSAELEAMIRRNINGGISTLITTDAPEKVMAIVNSVGRNESFATNPSPTLNKFMTAVFDWMDDKKLSKMPFIGVVQSGSGYVGEMPEGWQHIIVDKIYIHTGAVLKSMIDNKRSAKK